MLNSLFVRLRPRRFLCLWSKFLVPEAGENPEFPHFPDSYLGLAADRSRVVVHEKLTREYKCRPTTADARFIKTMIGILRNGAITWWEAAGVLNRFGVQLQSFHVCEILKKNIDSDAALGLFRWAEAQPGFKHDTRSYNRMLRTLGDDLNLKHMRILLREMDARAVRRTCETYMIAVMSYFNGSQVDNALETFFESEKRVRPKPKKKYYAFVLKRLLSFKRYDDVPVVAKSMVQVGHIADTETMNEILLELGQAGNATEAIELSRYMVKNGCAPDVHTFIHLMTGLVKSSCFERTSEVIADMAVSGCIPNAHNFNLLVEFLLTSDKALESLSMIKEMLAAGLELNSGASYLLAKFFEKQGDATLALSFYQDLAKYDRYPDLLGYTSLLKMLNAAGLIEEALQIYQQMKRDGGCPPDRDTNNIVLHVLSKAGKMKAALQIYKAMESYEKQNTSNENESSPNKVTYDILLIGLALDERLPECLKLFQRMNSRGLAPDRETYVRLITAFSNAGLHEQAFRLFGRMKLEGLLPGTDMHNAILKKRRRDMEAERKALLKSSANQAGSGIS